jgi:hypothetical protein
MFGKNTSLWTVQCCGSIMCPVHSGVYTPYPKKVWTLFLFFFSRCPVCGELHWLLLDTFSFDWNTRRSRGHKIFKMAPTKQQKALCAVDYAKTTSVITVQRNFRRQFEVDPPDNTRTPFEVGTEFLNNWNACF